MKIGLAGERSHPTGSAGASAGPLQPAFADDARALVLTEVFGTPYSDPILGALEHAILGGSNEYRAFQAVADGALTGVALFGMVSGTVGTARMLFVAAGTKSLVEAVTDDLSRHARLVIAELPDDRPFDRMRRLLLESGFREESRIPDLYRPGVAMTLLRSVIPPERA